MYRESHERHQSILKNARIYEIIGYLNASVLFWSISTLFYAYRGMSFFQIATIQSIGSIMTTILEIPTGWISDKFGYNVVLRVSSIAKICAVFFLIVAGNFWLFLASEACFALGISAQSGADTALLYESLKKSGVETTYTDIISKVRGRQALVRISVRLLAPVLYVLQPELPFVLSAVIYMIIAVLTYQYIPVGACLENAAQNSERSEGRLCPKLLEVASEIISNKTFIACSLLSSILLISVSNYSQYIGPYVEELGFNISYLGLITASASIGEYIGIKFTKKLKKCQGKSVLLILSGGIALLVIISGLMNSLTGAVIGYFGINLLHGPFTILLSDELQRVISSKWRATMLSISNQSDEIFSVLADPLIGAGIDGIGFGRIYFILGAITLIIVTIALAVVTKKSAEPAV